MKADFNSSIKEIDHICVMDDFDSMTLPPGIAPPRQFPHEIPPPPRTKSPGLLSPIQLPLISPLDNYLPYNPPS